MGEQQKVNSSALKDAVDPELNDGERNIERVDTAKNVADVLAKPFTIEQLEAAISKLK